MAGDTLDPSLQPKKLQTTRFVLFGIAQRHPHFLFVRYRRLK